MLLYIHGFNSSNRSEKAIQTAKYIEQHYPELDFHQPQLPTNILEAMALLESITQEAKQQQQALRFIGSSLGGYFASFLAEKYGGKAVLVNPAVKPYDLFEEFLGAQYNPYTNEHYQVLPQDREAVAQFDTHVIKHPD